MIALRDKSKCTGCTACAAVCPLHCIAMTPDEEGFRYPEIDRDRCVSCGQCEAVCPVDKPAGESEPAPAAYGVKAKDVELRLNSSSGGAFSLLAEGVLSRGGAVFGVAMAADCKSARHVMAESEGELAALRGSKYLQSDLEDTFRQVKKELEQRPVLFSGTPCQVDGLNAYLGQGYENLLTVEVICHGVPTPKLWEKYAEYFSAQSDGEIGRVEFRNKDSGWRHFALKYQGRNSSKLRLASDGNLFMRMFLQDLCLRPSCYQCPSKGLERTADLTIADFWGIENVAPELDDDKGTSLVLAHSEKGRKTLEAVLDKTDWRRVDCAAALQGNRAMLHSAERPEKRDAFMADVDRLPFADLEKKYVPRSGRDRIVDLVQKLGLMPLARKVWRSVHKK